MIINQKLEDYPQEQHLTWNFLNDRQKVQLQVKACQLCHGKLAMSYPLTRTAILMFEDMALQLKEATEWSMEIAPGLTPSSGSKEPIKRAK